MNTNLGLPLQRPSREGDVEHRPIELARTRSGTGGFYGLVGEFIHGPNEIIYGCFDAGSDVDEGTRSRNAARGSEGGRYVIDVDEVTRLIAGSKDCWRRAGKVVLEENGDDASFSVGVLTRTELVVCKP